MSGLLKFITCGSVDDGKSTLIGHILYDSKLLYADQEKALELDSKVGSRGGAIDYSLLLDGLMAEREQGITIDVAYRYFTTDKRSFIVADTPGHEEYTRNMAVGASFADLAVILIDAKQGVLVQTRRHARICALMGIRYFVFAVNKMDLVGYDEKRFNEIVEQINELSSELSLPNITIIPVSATEGDNVTKKSENIPWYEGPALLTYLEDIDIAEDNTEAGFYMPVQRVCRPDHTFRGFQGQIEDGEIHVGDEINTLPSNETATLLWMDDDELYNGKNFFVKLGTKMIPGTVTHIDYTIDVNTGEQKSADTLAKNGIAVCRIAFADRIVVDEFKKHKTLGELILIDRVTDMTSACGVVEEVHTEETGLYEGRIDRNVRAAIKGQKAIIVPFAAGNVTRDFVESVEKKLSIDGRHTYLYAPDIREDVNAVLKHLHHAGIIVLLFASEQQIAGIKVEGAEVYNGDWNADGELDADEIADEIRKESVYDAAQVHDGNYI